MTDEDASHADESNREVEVRQAQEELRRVEQAVGELTGLPSFWSGVVELHEEPDWRGAKPFGCDIRLDAARQKLDVRWRTLIHEMLHAHSIGYARFAFDTFPGWEEGVVEKLQRLLRPHVLERLGLTLAVEVFAAEDVAHEFNPYVAALETLYTLLQRPEESETAFYTTLLAMPLDQRMVWIMARGKQLPPGAAETFVRAFALASVILRRRLKP